MQPVAQCSQENKEKGLNQTKVKILELCSLRIAAFAKASRWDQTRKTPGLFSLKEKPRDIHFYYSTKNKTYKQWRAVSGSHVALAKSRILEIRVWAQKVINVQGSQCSSLLQRIDRKEGHTFLHTQSFVPNCDVLILLYALKVIKCTETSECPELAVVLRKPLSMKKNLHKQLWKPKEKRMSEQSSHTLKDFFSRLETLSWNNMKSLDPKCKVQPIKRNKVLLWIGAQLSQDPQ